MCIRDSYITVAAVDEGILQLTDFLTPDPIKYFLGKRRLGLQLLDLYGKLIETGGRPGQLKAGGDADSRQLDASGVRTVKTLALFSGPVALVGLALKLATGAAVLGGVDALGTETET